MPTVVTGTARTIVLPAGSVLTITLGSGASCYLVPMTTGGAPLTPFTITSSPTVIGPFADQRQYAVNAVGGTVTYDMGDDALITGRVLAQSGLQIVGPADTSENVLASVYIPGGMMGKNGLLQVFTLWGMTNSVNNKTLRLRLGGLAGTVIASAVLTTVANGQSLWALWNRGSETSQVGFTSGNLFSPLATGTGALVTASIDTSKDQLFVITGQKASAGESLTLEGYSVVLFPGYS